MADVLLNDLIPFIREGASRPFDHATCDCTSWVADWVMRRTGRDAMANWRGKYATKRGYLRLLRAEPDGLLSAASRGLSSINVQEIDPAGAQPGDVGIIRVVLASRLIDVAMAIRGPTSWVAKLGDGIYRTPEAIKAWRL